MNDRGIRLERDKQGLLWWIRRWKQNDGPFVAEAYGPVAVFANGFATWIAPPPFAVASASTEEAADIALRAELERQNA